uniref:Uncharacterized protein n=1 Tax=Anguilla anguilla TaxID=7936 RepID=A0A0E9WNU2_ANGAN
MFCVESRIQLFESLFSFLFFFLVTSHILCIAVTVTIYLFIYFTLSLRTLAYSFFL